MQDNPANTVSSGVQQRAPIGLVVFIVLALVLLTGGFLVWRSWGAQGSAQTKSDIETISASTFEQRYGLRLRLLAVTAGGGMIDLRLKITDPDKARAFLEDAAHLPQLVIAETGEALMGAEELGDDINWEEGGILFVLYSNNSGLIEPGTPVVVSFGDVQLEPVRAQ